MAVGHEAWPPSLVFAVIYKKVGVRPDDILRVEASFRSHAIFS
jgi:hypothetical protein